MCNVLMQSPKLHVHIKTYPGKVLINNFVYNGLMKYMNSVSALYECCVDHTYDLYADMYDVLVQSNAHNTVCDAFIKNMYQDKGVLYECSVNTAGSDVAHLRRRRAASCWLRSRWHRRAVW